MARPALHFEPVLNYLQQNPQGTFEDFKQKTGSQLEKKSFLYLRKKFIREGKIEPLIRRRRRKQNQKKQTPRASINKAQQIITPSSLETYRSIWAVSSEGLSKETKKMLGDMVKAIRENQKRQVELIEMLSPAKLELREKD